MDRLSVRHTLVGSRRASLRWLALLVASSCAVSCGRKTEPSRAAPPTSESPRPTTSASADVPPPAAPLPAPAPVETRPETRLAPAGPGAVTSTSGLVTSVESEATRAGVEMLQRGGNAVDAAVAVAFALAVTHPSAGNIGGGGFMLVRLGNLTEALDFRETTPRAMTRERFDSMIARRARDGAAVGVPGSVAGLHLAHERHGKLPWQDVLAPAIRLASKGHALGKRQAQTLRWSWPLLGQNPVAKATFTKPQSKTPLDQGELLRQPRLAVALERIASLGPAGFYRGATAKDLLASLGPHGVMTHEDLEAYRAVVRVPLRFSYRGWAVETMPPPSAGGVTLAQTLLMLERARVWEAPAKSAQRLHLLAEAMQRAQIERRFHVVDPDSLSADELSSKERRWLDPNTWLAEHPLGSSHATPSSSLHPLYEAAARELEHTTHFSVTDAQGGVVSCTMTLSASFGAKLMTRDTGIVLNNAVGSFASVGENTVVGGRRTTSSMAPTLVLDRGSPVLVLGTPGGDTIPSTIAQVLLNLVDDQASLVEAIDAPRIHHGFVPDEIAYERLRPIAPALRKELRALGHRVVASRAAIGDANNLALWEGQAYGYADPREGGLALAARPAASLASPSNDARAQGAR